MISLHVVRAGILAAVIALAGCAQQPTTQRSDVDVSAPTVSWNGTYRGTMRITGIGSGVQRRWCETDPQMIVQVAGNSFTYAMTHPNVPDNPTPVYSTTIAPDGVFQSQLGSGVMNGKVVGSHMSGTIDGSACVYAFSADRS